MCQDAAVEAGLLHVQLLLLHMTNILLKFTHYACEPVSKLEGKLVHRNNPVSVSAKLYASSQTPQDRRRKQTIID